MRKSNLEMVVTIALQNSQQHNQLTHSDNGYVDSHYDYYDCDSCDSYYDSSSNSSSKSSSSGGSINEFIDGCGKFCIYFVLGMLALCFLIYLITG